MLNPAWLGANRGQGRGMTRCCSSWSQWRAVRIESAASHDDADTLIVVRAVGCGGVNDLLWAKGVRLVPAPMLY